MHLTLTPREQRVVELAAEGHASKTIAAELDISEFTVNSYLRRAMAKLQTQSRAHMVAVYLRAEHDAKIAELSAQRKGDIMKWSEALNQAKECLQKIDDYVDSRGIAEDAREQIDKHAPDAIKDQLRGAVDLLERMLDALVDDPDTVPDEPATPDTVL